MYSLFRKTAGCLFIALLVIVCGADSRKSNNRPVVKNIILFIGDGMGQQQRKAAQWMKAGINSTLSMDHMPEKGFLRTRSVDQPITDSAAAATAMATGVRTKNGVLGMDVDLNPLTSILEQAEQDGRRTGLVTTTQITHATPAAFYAHVPDRDLMCQIAVQMMDSGADVLFGGGEVSFEPDTETGCFPEPGKRKDGRKLIHELLAKGYRFVCDETSLEAAVKQKTTTKVLGIFSDEGMIRPFSPSLAEMTRAAITVLSKGKSGFFLMVEGGQIDWACHDNDATQAISDTIGLDAAVEVAREFAATQKNTLIIVSADHETGGMRVSHMSSGIPEEDGPFKTPDGEPFFISWSTTGHTGVNVPVTAQGPKSRCFSGVHDNTHVYDVMRNAFFGRR